MTDARMVFFDWETRSDLDLTVTGTMRYVLDPSTVPLILSWGLNDGPIKLWCDDFSAVLHPKVWAYIMTRVWCYGRGKPRKNPVAGGSPFLGVPADIVDTAASPVGYFIASNVAFDRKVWQQIATPEFGFPDVPLEQFLDSQAQAQASNLPGSLDMAGRALNLGNKTVGGKTIMKVFADTANPLPGDKTVCLTDADVEKAIGMWTIYLDYGVQDTDLMRDVWKCTRPLSLEEWVEYWSSERINDRGLPFDLEVCAGAVQYRDEEAAYTEAECLRITDGVITSPTLTKQINEWVFDRLPDDLAETMVKQRDDEGYVTRLTGAKDVMSRLLEDIAVSETPPADEVIELLELLQFGRSSSAVKFEKVLNQAHEGRLFGSYVYNGATTGRFSSRGAQTHNMVRDYLKNELDVLDMVAAQVPIEELRKIGPVSSVLSKLIRPSIVAPEKKLLVWSDWAAIEARVAPWLAGTRDADQAVLEPFRLSDSDDTKPDVYVLNAADVFHQNPDTLWERYKNGDPEAKSFRQGGKVMVLSLAYRGSVGALKAMAKNYGIRLTNEEAKRWVDGWRDRNRWNKRFGVKIEEAAFSAMRSPMNMFKAGRISYQFLPDLMRGTLVAFLPDGRPLVYPMAKIAKIEKFGNEVDAITHLNGMGRRSLWDGLQIENCLAGDTQVVTRNGIKRLDEVQAADHVWDGIDFVRHNGLVDKGPQPVINLWGVSMTPDHKVLTDAGWKEAKDCKGLDRANVRLPDDAATIGNERGAREESPVGGAVRMRQRVDGAHRWLQKQSETVSNKLRLQNQGTARQREADAWHVGAPGVLGVAINGRPLHAADAPSVGELRWARDHGLPPVAGLIRDFLGGHGANVPAGADDRPREERRRVHPRELSVGVAQSTGAEHPIKPDDRHTEGADAGSRSGRGERHQRNDTAVSAGERLDDNRLIPAAECGQPVQVVYDLMDCGPRNRFTVLDGDGVPFIVHNCTQGAAASILRATLVRLEQEETEAETIFHTHDEIGAEVDEDKAWAYADRLEATMVRGFDWSEGLPLAAETTVNWFYSKNEKGALKRPA